MTQSVPNYEQKCSKNRPTQPERPKNGPIWLTMPSCHRPKSKILSRPNLDARSVPEALVNSFRILTPLRTRLNPPEPEIRLPKNSIRISTPDPHNRVQHARNPVRNAPPPAIETLWRFFHGRGDFVNRPNRTDHADRDTLGFFMFRNCRSGFETLGFFLRVLLSTG